MRLSIFLAILMVILANGEKFPRPKSPTVLETITTLTERIAKFKGLTSLDLMREVLLGSPVEGFETEDILKVCQRTFPDQGFDQLVELWEHNKLKKKSPKKPRPIVKTHLGSVQGVTTRGGSGTRYHYFMGLPYASRPERFMVSLSYIHTLFDVLKPLYVLPFFILPQLRLCFQIYF